MLQAGVSEVTITPPIGVELGGYGPDIGRYATDVHDPLTAQALALDDGQNRVMIITLDLIGVDAAFTNGVRREIEAQTGIPAGNIMIAAAHIHTAPTTMPSREWGNPDPVYVHDTSCKLVQAAVSAARALVPGQLSVGRTEHSALAWNRTGKLEVDPTVEIIRIDHQTSGEPLATVVHYACHPVILGPVPHVSADYPGALRQYLRQRSPGVTTLFMNGACGDIDPVTNREVWGSGTFSDVEQAGSVLGEAAWQATQAAMPCANTTIRTAQRRVRLQYQVPSGNEVRENIQHYRKQLEEIGSVKQRFGAVTETVEMPSFWLGYYEALSEWLERGEPPYVECDLQALYVGKDLCVLGLPAEVYTREGMAIRQHSIYEHTLTVCYANDLVGYIPPAEEFDKQSYAALLAAAVYDRPPFSPNVSAILVDAALELVTQ